MLLLNMKGLRKNFRVHETSMYTTVSNDLSTYRSDHSLNGVCECSLHDLYFAIDETDDVLALFNKSRAVHGFFALEERNGLRQ